MAIFPFLIVVGLYIKSIIVGNGNYDESIVKT